jgi:uncharacterized protein YjbI with pentapeptide repeats
MECKHHNICALTAEYDPEAGLCILHSHRLDKDSKVFAEALSVHCRAKRDQFGYMVFPERTNFNGAHFTKDAEFNGATFTKRTSFNGATFTGAADFVGATFTEDADFVGATFTEDADFVRATFTKRASFFHATFTKDANFARAILTGVADFVRATFLGEGNFQQTRFFGDPITFEGSRCSGRLLFTGEQEDEALQNSRIFEDATTKDATIVNFRDLMLDSPERLSFRHANFKKCQLLNTDLRTVELTGVLWPLFPEGRLWSWLRKSARQVVYDEILALELPKRSRPWEDLERLYRELKQNYEDRRDYTRAGDFHYGEKEMQRRNPRTPYSLKRLV